VVKRPALHRQRTLARTVECSGIGVHSARRTTIRINPAHPNHGIRFRRTDLPGTPHIQALFNTVVDTSLATVIGRDGAIVSTIEHLMATFSGLSIDNALVEIDTYEMPIMDGSAGEFTRLILEAGTSVQDPPRQFFVVTNPISVREGDKFVTVEPDTTFRITCSIDFPHPLIGVQELSFDLASGEFETEISRARTFGFVQDLAYLKLFSLGRGGRLDTAIVVDSDRVLNENGLRYPDEFVRHKLLDCIGDFSLLGMPILGHIRTHKSGHALNHTFIRALLDDRGAWETRPVAAE
jgi:UDP-3-O-[3-hydroxymyristoyl] N-acetylglucosamine deacetylase